MGNRLVNQLPLLDRSLKISSKKNNNIADIYMLLMKYKQERFVLKILIA